MMWHLYCQRRVLIEFQRYEPFDGTKKSSETWGDARYLALVLKKMNR